MIQNNSGKNLEDNQAVMRMVNTIRDSLENAKGLDIRLLDVRRLTDIADFMIIATGSSERHVKALSDRVLAFMKEQNWTPAGVEGEDSRNWILVDFIDVVVHIMLERTRKHYDLEGLWDDSLSIFNPAPDSKPDITSVTA